MLSFPAALAGACCAVAAMSGSAQASVVELKVTTTVRSVNHVEATPYVDAGDVATLTVRYDTEAGTSSLYGGAMLYLNAITYFSFELEREGVQTYSGSISGNFGQISVANDVNGLYGATDRLTFRIFDDSVDYPIAQNSTTPAGDLPIVTTGDAALGDFFFRDFLMHFSTVDDTVFDSDALPTAADLAMPDGGSPFGPYVGMNPWSAFWQFENYGTTHYCCAGSFGAGAPKAGDIDTYQIDFSVRNYTGDTVSEVPLPAALPLFAFGLAGFGALRRRRA